MILVFVDNKNIGTVADLVQSLKDDGQNVGYRNPQYFNQTEDCKAVYIFGDWPDVLKAYPKAHHIDGKASTDYTVAVLKEMRDDFSDENWEAFIADDDRTSVPK